ncbi:hypothetical protein NQ318_019809 [Aromia moschata]|uniref:GRIP domain-containing protein n=1 Tax=Aromia moschata TaxID=1265417 RepID=A0AAV8YL07_9CUCU|nr:hypothetical protein NQ318_019809 [Aromia moschata]
MDTSLTNDSRKANLEELSKEELVKRCKSLLTIAQKAKQAKDVLQDENNRLKQELDNKSGYANDVTQEIVEKLTQQKLVFVTTIEELKAKNSSLDSKLQIFEKELETCQEKLYTTDNENVSYKRQVTRLTDENEQLLTHLESLEKQIDELNKVGIQQRLQLLELESKAHENKPAINDNKVSELQCMLSVSLEEVKKLKSENNQLNEKVENLQINLSEKDKNIIVISEELQSKCDNLNKVTEELNEAKKIQSKHNDLVQEYEKLKRELSEAASQGELEEKIRELQAVNSNLKSKLKSYHSKITKFAGHAKELKEDKNRILQLFKVYTDQVKEWKEKLQDACQKFIVHISTMESENKQLKEEIEKLNGASSEIESHVMKEKSDLEKELNEAKATYESQLESIKRKNEEEIEILKGKLKEVESRNSNLNQNKEKYTKEYENQVEVLKTERTLIDREQLLQKNRNSELTNEVLLIKQLKQGVDEELAVLKQLNMDLTKEIKLLKQENASLRSTLEECQVKYSNVDKEIEQLTLSENELLSQVSLLKTEKDSLNIIIKEKETNHKRQMEEEQNRVAILETQVDDLNTQVKAYKERQLNEAAEKQLVERSCEEIKKLAEENKELTEENSTLHEKLDEIERKRLNVFHCESQTDEGSTDANDLDEQIANLKRENAELLTEMTEMNEAIKERGETISRLEVHCDEVMKKLQIYEAQANKNVDSITQKDEIIKQLQQENEQLKSKPDDVNSNSSKDEEINALRGEIEALREKLNSNFDAGYAESETMSTSTISRTEDANRLKDLEGSWEEKYGKLRNLAVKLKGKVRDLTNTLSKEQTEKEELQKKVTANLKSLQSLQNQSDKLEDDLEKSKQECKQYLNRLNSIGEDISKDKQLLVSKDDIISELKKELDGLRSDKQSMDNWKKQVSAKVQTLRKELEANNVLKKESENKIGKLTAELEEKEKVLKTEIENHKQTKNLLDLSNNECKKNSVLSLEMQDYERSVKETSKKLEKQQEQISNLRGQVESHKTTISALREQNALLEQRTREVEAELGSNLAEIATYKKKLGQLEEELQQKEDKVQSVNRLLEISRSENEELSTELSKVIAEHQKTNGVLKGERDHLRSQAMGLQQSLREAQDALRLKEDELCAVQREYEGYKVRAQSVLRQSQTRDVGLEEKLSEDVANFKAENSELRAELTKNLAKLKELEEAHEKSLREKEEGNRKVQEAEAEIEELKSQYAQLSNKHQRALAEHAETVRSLKLRHADTLSQCYRQQLAEQEARHGREVHELRDRIERAAPSPSDTPPAPPTAAREEGEGSESVDSAPAPSVLPVPLERLLAADADHEAARLRKRLDERDAKLAHLTALLADTEQDLAKHVQMNDLLKEEIRRHQRSVERERHAENLEYLKNVVFKFVTLSSGDERTRLVPVLNTILKLSPEETHKLNLVARGDTGVKGWANYLPAWSSPGKS